MPNNIFTTVLPLLVALLCCIFLGVWSIYRFILNVRKEVAVTSKRPSSVTAMCAIGFIALVYALLTALLTLYGLFIPTARQLIQEQSFSVGLYETFFLGILAGVGSLGLWRMKRWGLYIYTVWAIVQALILLVFGNHNLLIPGSLVILVVYGWKYFKSLS